MSFRLQPKFFNLARRLPEPLRKMLEFLTALFTLRNVILLFCVLNIKTLPMVWELRLIYRSWQSWLDKRGVARRLEQAATKTAEEDASALPISTHPLFAPLTISTTTPLLEIDHNLHKSNSTYFSDLDESRTALMVRLLSSTKFSPTELDGEGIKGRFKVILGSVHTTFLKEIKPYERYSVRSRILGWDRKWIVIGSVFVRPKNATDRKREKKEAERRARITGKSEAAAQVTDRGEVLFATALSKYVVKKGRFTVPPERCWKSAGWFPAKGAGETPPLGLDSSTIATPDTEPVNGVVKITEEDLRRKAQETAARAVEKLEQTKQAVGEGDPDAADEACQRAASRWSWSDIEAERSRGMQIADNWFRLDGDLKGLWEDDHERGIVR